MRVPRPTTIQQIYAEISAFADDRINGTGGKWWERPWKGDFFCIFWNAYENGYCDPLDSAPKSMRRLDAHEFHINGDILANHLRRQLLNGEAQSKESIKMIAELATWWDEWTFAWRHHPNKLKRKRWKLRQDIS